MRTIPRVYAKIGILASKKGVRVIPRCALYRLVIGKDGVLRYKESKGQSNLGEPFGK